MRRYELPPEERAEQLAPWVSPKALPSAANGSVDPPTWTLAAIRNLLADRDKNGLARYVRKVGAKVLISVPGFHRWVGDQVEDCGPFSDNGEDVPDESPDSARWERRPYGRKGR